MFHNSLILLAPRTGVEPVTYPLGGDRAIHCATGALVKGSIRISPLRLTIMLLIQRGNIAKACQAAGRALNR